MGRRIDVNNDGGLETQDHLPYIGKLNLGYSRIVWSKKLPNFAVKHVDLSCDFGHDVPCMGRCIDINNEGGLDIGRSTEWPLSDLCLLMWRK